MNGKVHNDNTTTARWNPPLAVNPAGTELFVGCSSRQTDRTNNAWIMTYGAKAIITNGLASATFDVIPMSSVAFTNLFAGTTNSSPPTDPWLFDPVWPQGGVCLDASAAVVDCSSPSKVWTTPALYANFCADDYTWDLEEDGKK